MIKLSATMTVRVIVEGIVKMIPPLNSIEMMALNAFRGRLLRISEAENEKFLDYIASNKEIQRRVLEKLALQPHQ